MVATLYSDILREAARTNFRYGDVELRDWFRDKALQLSSQNVSGARIINSSRARANHVSKPTLGRMLFYNYDPKWKDVLPYYDTFPLIFPIEHYDDGWLGINVHYLPPVYRARLMDALYDTLNNKRYDEKTKLKINYQILKAASKFRYFKPCIKRYLKSHVRSQLLEIDVKEWDYVLMLPLARFKKAHQRTVWDESVQSIMNSRR